jgi:hypothetical protein
MGARHARHGSALLGLLMRASPEPVNAGPQVGFGCAFLGVKGSPVQLAVPTVFRTLWGPTGNQVGMIMAGCVPEWVSRASRARSARLG